VGVRRPDGLRGIDVIGGIAVLLLLCAVVACGDGEDARGGGSPGAPGADELDGRRFVAEGLTMSFLDDRLSARPGCNTLGGPFTVAGGRLVVDELATTSMACEDPALMARDAAFAAFLDADPTVTLDGPTLTLAAPGTTWVLTDREVAEPDRPVVGAWTLETLIDGGTASSVAAGVVAGLTIDDDPTSGRTAALWATGCEGTSAGVVVDAEAGTLTFTDVTSAPAIDCPPSATTEEDRRVQGAMDAVLSGTVTYQVDADVLTLTDGERGLQLRSTG
jgi:heat shock protein HslJ